MRVSKAESISNFLQERIAAGDFPSAVYLVAERGEIVFIESLGAAVMLPRQIPVRLDTIYDLASLTKPLVTGLLSAKLIESGEIALDDKISKFFSEFERDDKRNITIRDLLAHVSGFPAWQPFYLLADEPDKVLSVIADHALENPPETKVRYSDFNFVLLGFLLEKLHGKRLDEIAELEIFLALGLTRTLFNPPLSMREEIAACELGNGYEKQTCREMGFDFAHLRDSHSAFRNRLIWGEVHDGNCRILGGVSGHAGLFSCAEEVFKIALQFLPDHSKLLKPETCDLFRTNFTSNLNESRSLSFELAATKDSTASAALAKDSFGHLGFTGTSLWIEPETERVFILLTNRTHRPQPFVNINSTRRKFHELATELLNKN